MHGNVWEWCEDGWHESYAEKPGNLKTNGNIIWSGDSNFHILRGGSWYDYARGLSFGYSEQDQYRLQKQPHRFSLGSFYFVRSLIEIGR